MERRGFPRHSVRGMSLKATLVLMGGSVLREDFSNAIEIKASPIDMSLSGMRLTLDMKTHWGNIAPGKDVELLLMKDGGSDLQSLHGQIVHVSKGGRTLGVKLSQPLQNMAKYLIPTELQQ